MENIPNIEHQEEVTHYFLLTKLMYEYLAEQAELYRIHFKEGKPVAFSELQYNHSRTTRLLGKLAYRYERWEKKQVPPEQAG